MKSATKTQQFLEALETFSVQRGIKKEEIKANIEEVFTKIYKTKFDLDANVETIVDLEKGTIDMFNYKKVVEKIDDELSEITLDDPRVVKEKLKVGDIFKDRIDYSQFSRLVTQQIRQMLVQKTREAEKELIYKMYEKKINEIITTTVYQIMPRYAILNIGKTSAFLPSSEMNPLEKLEQGQRLDVYVLNIDKVSRNAQIIVSRASGHLVTKLLESHVTEITDGIIEIVGVARQAGFKTKIFVKSHDHQVDPVGSCIGIRGSRIKTIMKQIGGERIDVIPYSEHLEDNIAAALQPAKIHGIQIKEVEIENQDGEKVKQKNVTVIVEEDQYLVAIGKRGVNARLASKLTDTKIDIKRLSDPETKEIEFKILAGIVEIENESHIDKLSIQDDKSLDAKTKEDKEKLAAEYEKYMEQQEQRELEEEQIIDNTTSDEIINEEENDDEFEEYAEMYGDKE